jgi:riboflavin kinase/FMN adenylyltransferase
MMTGSTFSLPMQVFRNLPPPAQRVACALTIGNFDGVHRGHQALLAEVRDAARRLSIAPCVLTFEPHPREFFAQRRPALQPPHRIAGLRDKLGALAAMGIERTCVMHFNERIASLDADDFVDQILVEGLQVKWLMIGDDFRYGAERRGDFNHLSRSAHRHGFELHSMPTVLEAGRRVSSSAVRESLGAGDLTLAERLLGRPYAVSGHVVHGRKLGRTLGFPTLNLRMPPGRPALAGIFVVRVHGLASGPLPAVASLGTRPAVESEGAWLLETHLLDWQGDAYGRIVRIEFLRKLRDEAHYESLDALTAQIRLDASAARAHFDTLREAPLGALHP